MVFVCDISFDKLALSKDHLESFDGLSHKNEGSEQSSEEED
jgi:hypothetical protein